MKGPTQQYSDTIKSLQSRIQALEDENRLLKERLEEAGVSYANIVSGDAEGVVELYDPDQGARIKKFDVTDKIASDFFMMFCRGRKDVYDLRYTNPKTGKNGYYSQCFNRWDRGCHIQKKDGVRCKDCELRAYKPVTLPLIKAHMNGTDPNGNDVVAIYPMLENNLCQLLVFDFDNHAKGAEQEDYANIDDGWKEEINALRRICKNLDVDAVVERSRSGRGAHLWIFFKEMVPARLARRFGFALLEKGAESVNLKSFKYYDRMIPTQDALPEGGLGNVIALPLQGMALKSGNSAFIDENWNAYEDQLNVLAGTRRLTRQGIEDYLSLWYSTGSISEDNGTDAPWDKNSEIEAGSVKGVVRIVLADRIYIDSTGMSNKTKRQLRRMATFSNKQYFQNQAMDMPNYDESRFIYLGSDEGKYIVLPRGLREEILKKFDNAGISYKIEDKRTKGQELNISFRGELRESQIPAVETMLENETGILHAATAFGKTVVCCDMIARRGISTLILVDRADLMNQWIKRLEEFLDIDEELPEYQTKTGRTRKRKSLIGNLQGAHDTLTGIVDVAMIRSLKKKDGFHPKLKEYAQVYFDECHHAASDSAIEVLQEINAKYVYGVTATPKRGDGKEKINEFLLGPIRYIIALASIYMSAIENNCHIDYDGKLFKRIFEQHPTVWNEYVDWIKSKDTMCGDGNEHKIIELIWGDDKWRECVEYAFKVLIDDDVIFHIKEPADMLFTNTTDETILERKKYWLIEKLRETSLELKKCKKLIEMVVNVLPDWKLEYILEFLKINKNPEDFKEIPLFPSSYSWSGSEIPLIMEKIDFLKSLKDNIKGINFIEHRKYIEEYRMNLERYKDNVELREYLENADYA